MAYPLAKGDISRKTSSQASATSNGLISARQTTGWHNLWYPKMAQGAQPGERRTVFLPPPALLRDFFFIVSFRSGLFPRRG